MKGRGASSNPTSRFDRLAYAAEPDGEHPGSVPTQYFADNTKSIISYIDSPDLGMSRSVNPYRGCTHGCSYCYARPMHEYLGLSAGLDFESKIFVKKDAPELLRAELMKRSYIPEPIAMSGATDCYQFVERELGLTRRCLEVLAEFRHPVFMITKSALVERDADVLSDLARDGCSAATISITSLDADLQRKLEPRASTPRARLAAVKRLAEAGVPTGVNIAPVIPGLTDHELPAIIRAAAEAGAERVNWTLLRLPHGVKELFDEWLSIHAPLKQEKVLSKMRQLHGGKLYDSTPGKRMRGEGILSEQIAKTFEIHVKRHGLNREHAPLNTKAFRRPEGQLELDFG